MIFIGKKKQHRNTTLKRKREIRNAIRTHNEDHSDNFFDSTPVRTRKPNKYPVSEFFFLHMYTSYRVTSQYMVWYLSYYTSWRHGQKWVLLTKLSSYECTVILGIYTFVDSFQIILILARHVPGFLRLLYFCAVCVCVCVCVP